MNQLQKLHKKENDIAFIRNINSKDTKPGAKGKQIIEEDEDDNEDTHDDYAINAWFLLTLIKYSLSLSTHRCLSSCASRS